MRFVAPIFLFTFLSLSFSRAAEQPLGIDLKLINPESQESSRARAGLTGLVKSEVLNRFEFVLAGEKLIRKKRSSRIRIFNRRGDILERSEFSSSNQLITKYTYKYDSTGMNYTSSWTDPIAQVVRKSNVRLRAGTRIMEHIENLTADRVTSKISFQFNANEQWSSWAMQNNNGDVRIRCEIKYERGKIIEKSLFDAKGNRTSKVNYKYDLSGNKVEFSGYTELGAFVKTYKFNKEGRKVREVSFTAGKRTHTNYKHNKAGHVSEAAEFGADGRISSKVTFEYDAKGNITRKTKFRALEHGKEVSYSKAEEETWEYTYFEQPTKKQ